MSEVGFLVEGSFLVNELLVILLGRVIGVVVIKIEFGEILLEFILVSIILWKFCGFWG